MDNQPPKQGAIYPDLESLRAAFEASKAPVPAEPFPSHADRQPQSHQHDPSQAGAGPPL